MIYRRILPCLILLFICSGSLPAQHALPERMDLEGRELPLESVLKMIEQKTHYRFSYSRDVIPVDLELTFKFEGARLDKVLRYILDEADLNYKVVGQQILLFPRPRSKPRERTLNGYVMDKNSGERLIGAMIYDQFSKTGTYSNEYGFYSLRLPRDSAKLLVQYLGYASSQVELRDSEDQRLDLEVEALGLRLADIVIEEEEFEGPEDLVQMSQHKLSMMELRRIPALGAEVDVLRTLQLLPGVAGGHEGTVGLYVRGGRPDQNLILLDDVPVYNPSHIFGFASAFNASALKSITLTKGGFPARYGGRLSSVLDVRLKEGNMQEHHLDVGIGLAFANLMVEGPIKKDKASFMLAGRRTYLDFLVVPMQKLQRRQNPNSAVVGGSAFDWNAKFNVKLSGKDRLYLSYYHTQDATYDNYEGIEPDFSPADYSDFGSRVWYRNQVGALRWNHQFSKRLFANTTAIFSDYIYRRTEEEYQYFEGGELLSGFTNERGTGVRDQGLKTDFFWRPGQRHTVRFGGAIYRRNFSPRHILDTNIDPNGTNLDDRSDPVIDADEGNVYLEDEINFSPRLRTNIGIHASNFRVENRQYPSLQPRMAVRFLLNEHLALKGSFATMQQNLHLISSTGIGLPTDLWLPPTAEVAPQRSWQAVLGAGGSIGTKYSWTVEAYLKEMYNVLDYQSGTLYFSPDSDWEEQTVSGHRKAEGVEFFLRKNEGKVRGWMGYTLSRVRNQYDEFNNGEWFLDQFDRRHDVSLAIQYQPRKNIELSANWKYMTGAGVTLPVGLYSGGNVGRPLDWSNLEPLTYFGDRNNHRLPDYHRLDLGVSLYKQNKRSERWWTISIYNAYNHHNAFFVRATSVNGSSGAYNYETVSFFPIIPSVSYRLKI